MNKKFLSAILFGALMATSAGTFVSCKDYDDDIKNLQTQIDTNKTAIAELQKLVGAGNWVTSVAASGENLVVTMSNGTTATIAGIKGADGQDGKNAAEWTIGEDGYWYVDGEKTANLAVAQNGKDGVNGLTAPSPKIENGVWVVYNWDVEKGEFVEEVTEISAAGTSAYVVLKNGAYILNIADENGEFVEVSLPATAESFTISGIANKDVKVVLSYGEWTPATTKKGKELFDKLAAEFPELKEYEKGDFVEQGGRLPFVVSPANVELTKEHTFALVDMKGENAGATLINPTKGMPEGVDLIGDEYVSSRAAESAAVWSLEFAPAKNEKGNDYEDASLFPYSLVVSGPKGVIASTAYVYTFDAEEVDEFEIDQADLSMKYAEEIDIFVPTEKNGACVTRPKHMLKDMFILEVKDAAVAEEYGIEIEGSVVSVKNMPKGQNTKAIDLILTAIGVNGEVAQDEFALTIENEIAATGTLADQDITLKATFNADGTWANNTQTVLWDVKGLGLSALQLKNFVEATTKTFTIVNDDEDAAFTTQTANVVFLNDKKKPITGTVEYTKVAYLAYTLDASDYVPGDYTVTLEAKNTSVIYKAEADMVVANPEESLLTLNADFVDANGVYNAVGEVDANGKVSYNLASFFKNVTGYNDYIVTSLVDLDYEYDTEIGAWLTYTKNASDEITSVALDYADVMTWSSNENAYVGDINQTRNFKIQYMMFNNANNIGEFEFQVKLISNIYAADPTSVIKMTAATAKFDDNTATTTVDESKVDLSKLFSAIYAAGGKKGTAYNLFFTDGGKKTETTDAVLNYASPKYAGQYVVKGGNFVSFTAVDYLKLYNDKNPTELAGDPTLLYITMTQWTNIWNVVKNYYNQDGTKKYRKNGTELVKDADGNYIWDYTGTKDVDTNDVIAVGIFETYKSLIDFDVTTASSSSQVDKADTPRAGELYKVEFKFVNATDADYFDVSTLTATASETSLVLDAKESKNIDITTLTEGQKVIPMKMIVTDIWGMKMTYNFNVTLSL